MKKLLIAFNLFIGIGSFCSCSSDDEEYVYIENYLDGGINIFHAKDTLININKGEEVIIDIRHDAIFESAIVSEKYRDCLEGKGTKLIPINNKIVYPWLTLEHKSQTEFSIKAKEDLLLDGCPEELFFQIDGGKRGYGAYMHISLGR